VNVVGVRKGAHIKTYRAWQNMKTRCLNSKYENAENYKHIMYDTRWEEYDNFLADMGEALEGLQLDRIDNLGHYTKENCRWVSAKENVRNSRVRKLTLTQVRAIQQDKRPSRTVAKAFGIGKSQVLRIRNGAQWFLLRRECRLGCHL